MAAGHSLLGVLAVLFTHIVGLALITFGGVNTVLPALHHQAVNEQHWMTDRDFANFFALSSVSPGPNFLLLTLIGYKAAGVAGAIVATLALCGPTSLIAYLVVRVWDRFKDAPWRSAMQRGLVPVTVGFVAAAAVLLVRASDNSLVAYALTAITAIVGLTTRLNPLWVFAASALAGALGLV
jgi:chromate transporter